MAEVIALMGPRNPDEDGDLEIQVNSVRKPSSDAVSGDPGEAKPLFAAVRSRREQRRRSIIVTATLSVALVALVLSIAPTREALLGAVFGPAPTATDAVRAGEDNLYVTVSPNWGSVSLDDKPLPHLPVEGVEQPLRLSRGVHVLRWQFDPIIRYACVLTVPSSDKDDCPARVGIAPHKKGIARVVPLQLSLSTVAPEYYNPLTAAIQAALDAQQSTEIVRPGERYIGPASSARDNPVSVVATQPLRATLRFVSDVANMTVSCVDVGLGPEADCMMNGDCHEICTAPWQDPQNMPDVPWDAYIVAHASWRYTTLNGRVVADNQSDIGGQLQFLGHNARPIPITIDWDGSNWRVAASIGAGTSGGQLADPSCAGAQSEVTYQEILPPELPGQSGGGALWTYIQGDPVAEGCLIAALPMTAQGTPDISPQSLFTAGLILHRFGVSLAVNASAHRYWPTMPVADAYEQAIAQKLVLKVPEAVGAAQGG
ncbi:MAG TPA: hypothetical protein VF040_04545 [Ktedonobacterales bacterium]